ncbi:hypothetical protein BDV11DRAFT_188004 [Aspergillus similis]
MAHGPLVGCGERCISSNAATNTVLGNLHFDAIPAYIIYSPELADIEGRESSSYIALLN